MNAQQVSLVFKVTRSLINFALDLTALLMNTWLLASFYGFSSYICPLNL